MYTCQGVPFPKIGGWGYGGVRSGWKLMGVAPAFIKITYGLASLHEATNRHDELLRQCHRYRDEKSRAVM